MQPLQSAFESILAQTQFYEATSLDQIQISVENSGRGIHVLYSSMKQTGADLEHAPNRYKGILQDEWSSGRPQRLPTGNYQNE
jgi:hypothetical protein